MIIAGASRHAKEVLQLLNEIGEEIVLFDDVSLNIDTFFANYTFLRNLESVTKSGELNFILGLGGTQARYKVAQKLKSLGLIINKVIASTAVIGTEEVFIGNGVNIMNFAFISNATKIGEGV